MCVRLSMGDCVRLLGCVGLWLLLVLLLASPCVEATLHRNSEDFNDGVVRGPMDDQLGNFWQMWGATCTHTHIYMYIYMYLHTYLCMWTHSCKGQRVFLTERAVLMRMMSCWCLFILQDGPAH